MTNPSPSRGSEEELGKLLDAFEKAGTERSIARNAFHRGEKWVWVSQENPLAPHQRRRTEKFMIEADDHARAARQSVESYVSRLRDEIERRKEINHALVESNGILIGESIGLTTALASLKEQQLRLSALHELIADDILFCHRNGGFVTSDDDKSSLGYSVFCSDTFALACADAERITPEEAVVLHKIMRGRPEGIAQHHIATVWVAWKRGLTRKDIAYQEERERFPQEAFDYALRLLSTSSNKE